MQIFQTRAALTRFRRTGKGNGTSGCAGRKEAAMTHFIVSLLLIALSVSGQAQINSWTKSTSGNWEEPFWSAGTLPSSASDVMFTNAGYKALALSPSTRAYPDSLTVHSLTISSP